MIQRIPTTTMFAGLCLLGAVSLLFSFLSLAGSLAGGNSPWATAEACCTTAVASFSVGWILLAMVAAVSLVTIGRIVLSAARHYGASNSVRSLARLASPETVAGYRCLVLEEDRPIAFCAGLLRPRVFVSRAMLTDLSPEETHAVLAHEDHHRRRRDPLRRMVSRVLVDGFFLLPALREFGSKCIERSEIAADQAAATQNPGGSPALARALLRLHGRHGESSEIALSPERLGGLAGEKTSWTPSRSDVLTTLAALFALLAGPVTAVELVTRDQVGIQLLGFRFCLVALIIAPLMLAAGLVWKPPSLRI